MQAIWTLLIGGYVLTVEWLFPQIYNIWAILAVETLTLIFWLVGFALLASIAATIDSCLDKIDKADRTLSFSDLYSAVRKCSSIEDFLEASFDHDIDEGRNGQRCLAGGAGLGAICL